MMNRAAAAGLHPMLEEASNRSDHGCTLLTAQERSV
jgi:hypothetical protein